MSPTFSNKFSTRSRLALRGLRWMVMLGVVWVGLAVTPGVAQAQYIGGSHGDTECGPRKVGQACTCYYNRDGVCRRDGGCDCSSGGECSILCYGPNGEQGTCSQCDWRGVCTQCNVCDQDTCRERSGWYDQGSEYKVCSSVGAVTKQDQEYRSYACPYLTGGIDSYETGCVPLTTDTRTVVSTEACTPRLCTRWSACSNFGGACDESGTHSRTCYSSGCSQGQCYESAYTVEESCRRNTDGQACGSGSCGSWSSCSYSGTCDESSTKSRRCSNPTCEGGSCRSNSYTDRQSCSRNTDGRTCSSTQYSGWSSCSYSDTCDESATQTRTKTAYDCSNSSCDGDASTVRRSCSRDTDGRDCGSDGWYDSGSDYACCGSGGSCNCQDQEYRDYACGSSSCDYDVTNTRTRKSGCSSCSDGNSCTVDTCSSGSCGHTDIDDDNDGYTACENDCRDSDASVNPGQSESCNGRDDDCDGRIDEGCNCIDGQTRSCGENTGVCQTGTQRCNNGNWGSCRGEVGASAETCNGADDDCDGRIDENFGRLGDSCTDGQGACRDSGQYVCNAAGSGVRCSASAGSAGAETCNGVDDDCDGRVDESLTRTCGSSTGACSTGIKTCSGGSYGACQGSQAAVDEVCNGVDDDCDGDIDEDFANLGDRCSAGTGVCADSGTYVCNQSGSATTCTAVAGSAGVETCNGVDDDCDGAIDEGNPGGGRGCATGRAGVCSPGTTVCAGGQSVCRANVAAGPEVCDGQDNDCDGQTDEGVKTTYYADTDGDGHGDASTSIRRCSQPASYVTNADDCDDNSAATHPGADEMCNGADDDCDGVADEAFANLGDICRQGTGACRASGQVVCNAAGDATTCNAQAGSASAETCNGVDDDCNGRVDDGNPGGGLGCDTGRPGVCSTGTTVCKQGAIECRQGLFASTEICNSRDDDCDGSVDEQFANLGRSCAVGTGECRDSGAYVCNNSGTAAVCNAAAGAPADEVCNGLDDDCDGAVDNGPRDAGQACDTGNPGVCANGTTVCRDAALDCVEATSPTAETCGDGLDNNCNGEVDEGCQDNGWEFDSCNRVNTTETDYHVPWVMFMVDRSNSMVTDGQQRNSGCKNWMMDNSGWTCGVNDRLGWWRTVGYYDPYRYPQWPENAYSCTGSGAGSCFANFTGRPYEAPSYGQQDSGGSYKRPFWYGADGSKWDIAREQIIEVASSYKTNDGTNRMKFGFGTFANELADNIPAAQSSWGKVHLEAFNYTGASDISDYYQHPQEGGVGWGTPTAAGIRAMFKSSTVSDPNRPTAGVLITDGKPYTHEGGPEERRKALDAACDHAKVAPMYVLGFGSGTDQNYNNLLAAAGGTGTCADASGQTRDVCQYDAATVLNKSFDCQGSYQVSDGDQFEAALDDITSAISCTYPIDTLGSPTGAAPADPSGTRVYLGACDSSSLTQFIDGGDFDDDLSNRGVRTEGARPNLTCQGTCGGTNWTNGYVTYPVETTPGVEHTLRVRVADYLHDCRDPMDLGVYLDGQNGANKIGSWTSVGSASWTTLEFNFTPTNTTSYITLRQENDACCKCSNSCNGTCPDTETLNDLNLRIDQLEVVDPSGGCSPSGRLGYVAPGQSGDGWRYSPDRDSVELVGQACTDVQRGRYDEVSTQMACPCKHVSGSACNAESQQETCTTGTWQCTDTWNDTCVAGTTCQYGCGPITHHTLEQVQPNVQMVVDRSGSMGSNYIDGDSLWELAESVVEDLADWSFEGVGCSPGQDPSHCDKVQLGVHFWNSGEIPKLAAAEDTSPADIDDIFDEESPPSGGTQFHEAADLLQKEDALKDAENPNVGIFVTDGNTSTSSLHTAADTLCDIRRRADAPVATYALGFGENTNYQSNALVAAAGGTGTCCDASSGSCDPTAAGQAIDPCDVQTNASIDYDDLYCEGAITATTGDALEQELLDIFNSLDCSYPLTLPEGMDSASENPEGTTVQIFIPSVNALVDVPYIDDDGQPLADDLATRGISNPQDYADDGWSFGNEGRTYVQLSDDLCQLVRDNTVNRVDTQACLACTETGNACQVECEEGDSNCGPDGHKLGRCGQGVYTCVEGVDTCVAVRSAQPEICNGLDDDCDGQVDDLSDNNDQWPSADLTEKYDGEYSGYACYNRDVCLCPNGPDTYGGSAESSDEYKAMLDHQVETGQCYCGAALRPQHASASGAASGRQSGLSGASPPAGSSAQTASCSVGGSHGRQRGGLAWVVGAGLMAWIWRRKRRRRGPIK